jgi:hypothetical protein
MLSDNDLQRWLTLESRVKECLGENPGIDDILFFIGMKEAGLPPKTFTEYEKRNIIQMAECTVLVPGRYYQLFWVEDSGWPHYTELQRLPIMNAAEREDFFKPYVLLYAQKNRII